MLIRQRRAPLPDIFIERELRGAMTETQLRAAEAVKYAARPVLKWAGGKGQLLEQMSAYLPSALYSGAITRYIEPFVGGGAFFFYLSQKFSFKEIFLFDINPELVILYNSVKNDADKLIAHLKLIEKEYYEIGDQNAYYYAKRQEYNNYDKFIDANIYQKSFIERAALTVFLNRTCFNGLFRVNRKGEFNVPAGRYKNPRILDIENIRSVSALLRNVHIFCADFAKAMEYTDEQSFIYYDPPYRPLNSTSSFNAYSHEQFDDNEQRRLKTLFAEADKRGAKQMLSNADPTNYKADNFFDRLYEDYHIYRLWAKRRINADSQKRGFIREVLITNY